MASPPALAAIPRSWRRHGAADPPDSVRQGLIGCSVWCGPVRVVNLPLTSQVAEFFRIAPCRKRGAFCQAARGTPASNRASSAFGTRTEPPTLTAMSAPLAINLSRLRTCLRKNRAASALVKFVGNSFSVAVWTSIASMFTLHNSRQIGASGEILAQSERARHRMNRKSARGAQLLAQWLRWLVQAGTCIALSFGKLVKNMLINRLETLVNVRRERVLDGGWVAFQRPLLTALVGFGRLINMRV